MSFVQTLLTSILPRSWSAEMEKESRAWMARCEGCRHERSIWDMGGVRWKAAGTPRRLLLCPQCRRATWHVIHRPSV
jgi:hypothetical protein